MDKIFQQEVQIALQIIQKLIQPFISEPIGCFQGRIAEKIRTGQNAGPGVGKKKTEFFIRDDD